MAPKIQSPENLKADLPPNKFGKILGATPIIMTVIATMLAGLASSEMTKAQYDRAMAAQLQSKAGDQWSYFQAKKLRSAVAQRRFGREDAGEHLVLDPDQTRGLLSLAEGPGDDQGDDIAGVTHAVAAEYRLIRLGTPMRIQAGHVLVSEDADYSGSLPGGLGIDL